MYKKLIISLLNFICSVKKLPNLLVKDYLVNKDIKKTMLAKALDITPQNLSNKLTKSSMDVTLLYSISEVLKHDFFADISSTLQNEMRSKGVIPDNAIVIRDLSLEDSLDNFFQKKYPNIFKK